MHRACGTYFGRSETTATQLSGSALCSHQDFPKDSRIHDDCAGDCIGHSTTMPACRRTTLYAYCSILLLTTLRHISRTTRSPTRRRPSLIASSEAAMRSGMQSAAHTHPGTRHSPCFLPSH